LGIKAPYSHIFVHELQHLLGSHPPTRLVSNELQFRVVATRNTETKLYESSLGRFTIPLDCYLITRQFLEVWIRVVRQGLDGREQLELAYVKLADGDSDADGQPGEEKFEIL
jgi:hypothetical protein